jgi:hypothetical protein
MPFPFIPGGLLLALTVLGTTLVAFGLALKSLDWSIDAARRTALAGIVTGLRYWQSSPAARVVPTSPSSTGVEEVAAALDRLEPVAPDRTHRRREG